jgi:hypothetical protein
MMVVALGFFETGRRLEPALAVTSHLRVSTLPGLCQRSCQPVICFAA